MEILRKVFQQTSWQIIGKAVTSFSTILILGMITRQYGIVGTGILTLTLAYFGFFNLAVDFGINAYLMPDLLGQNLENSFRKLLGLRILWSAVLIVLALLMMFIWPVTQEVGQVELFRSSVALGVALILFSGIFVSTTAIFQSRLRFDLNVLATVVGALVTLGVVIGLSQIHTSISYLILGYLAGGIVTAFLGLLFVRQFIQNIWPLVEITSLKKVAREIWPMSATLLLNVVYFRIDAFILSTVKSFAEVGIYNVAYQIFQSLLVVPAYIMNSFYPLMLSDFTKDRKKFIGNLIKASFLMFGMAFVGMILTLIFSPLVIEIITGGKGFAGSATSLQILSLGFPAFFLSSVLMWTLIVFKKYKIMLAIYFTGLIFNILLNLILIPSYSYLGASVVTVLSEYLILILQLVILTPTLRQK